MNIKKCPECKFILVTDVIQIGPKLFEWAKVCKSINHSFYFFQNYDSLKVNRIVYNSKDFNFSFNYLDKLAFFNKDNCANYLNSFQRKSNLIYFEPDLSDFKKLKEKINFYAILA